MGWRVIDSNISNPYYVTAADDMLAHLHPNTTKNTLHFYQRQFPTISVGRTRKIHDDINLDVCTTHNIKIIRRISGGGTIFTDKNCLIYSLSFQTQNNKLYHPQKQFNKICQKLAQILQTYHPNIAFKPPNDITLNGKKISGSAQMKQHNTILIHGTILVDTNLTLMHKALHQKTPKPVSTLTKELGYTPSIQTLKKQLLTSFETLFNSTMHHEQFTPSEQEKITNLMKNKYLKTEWNFMR